MRKELSKFMNGESIKLVARFQRYGCMNFDGAGRCTYTNPLTKLSIPMEFFEPEIPIDSKRFTDKTSLIEPLFINDTPVQLGKNSHMWVIQRLECQGQALKSGNIFQAYGHIEAYTRRNGTQDFSFVPYGGIEVLQS